MNIQIERPHVEALIARFPAHAGLSSQLRFGDRVELDLAHLSGDEFDFLEELYRAVGSRIARPSRAARDAARRRSKAQGKRFEAGDLEDVLPALVAI